MVQGLVNKNKKVFSGFLRTSQGAPQGNELDPLLFIIYLNYTINNDGKCKIFNLI